MTLKMKGRCETIYEVYEKEIQNKLWDVYLAELGPGIKQETAIPQQCFRSFEIFKNAMLDQDFIKFVLFSDKNEIIGLAISSSNLKKIKEVAGIEINLSRYESLFPEEYKQRKLHYVPVTCILKNYHDEGYMNNLGEAIIKEVNKNKGKAAFDFAEEKNGGLDEMVAHIARETNLRPDAKITIVGRQTFVVIG